MKPKMYGVIIDVDEGRGLGRILSATTQRFSFRLDQYAGLGTSSLRKPVTFEVADANRNWIASQVEPIELETQSGRVTYIGGGFGLIQLDDRRQVYFSKQILPDGFSVDYQQQVRCMPVPGREKRWFALTVELESPKARRSASVSVEPILAAATRKGRNPKKSLNDDAFLITEPDQGSGSWLLAVADGVSHPPPGWWASNKCMELLWRSRQRFSNEIRFGKGEVIMKIWLNDLRRQFLRERNDFYEFKQSSSTLTFALIQGDEFYYAHCGDTRLLTLTGNGKLNSHVREYWRDQTVTGSDHQKYLRNHVGASDTDWSPAVGTKRISPGGLLLLCSDGVISNDPSEKKFGILKSLAGARNDLQQRVNRVIDQISAFENDDLTLIAYRPTERT